MGIKKFTSLKAEFWKFLSLLLVGLIGSVLLPFGIMLLSVACGYATYADYSERSVKNIAPVIAAAPDLTKVSLPLGCEFLWLDKSYRILGTSMEGEELKQAMEYALSGQSNANPEKQYLLVTREKEYVILQYSIGSRFTNEWMNEHLPSPETLLCILIGINCAAVCVILTGRFAKKLRLQLTPLFEATEEIAGQNLEFETGHSQIREFEDVLLSFSDMKEKLKTSLEQQWKAEQSQKEQIAALAHDLKTPITVIQGNTDLLRETDLDGEQALYTGYISDSLEQLQSYLKLLIDISGAAAGYQLRKESIELAAYLKGLKAQILSLCHAKEIQLQMNVAEDGCLIEADSMLLERAVMNVINNALDYSPQGGTIWVETAVLGEFLQIIITDEGSGFSPKALQYAQEKFFMEDSSRSSKMHFGMGLYIAASVMQQHGGSLILENDEKTHGARVTMRLPF